MDALQTCLDWLLESVQSIYMFLYSGAGWIGISVIGITVLRNIVNLFRRVYGR